MVKVSQCSTMPPFVWSLSPIFGLTFRGPVDLCLSVPSCIKSYTSQDLSDFSHFAVFEVFYYFLEIASLVFADFVYCDKWE